VFGLDVSVDDVPVMNELQGRTELNEQIAHLTLRVRVLVVDHVTKQIHGTLQPQQQGC